MTQSAPSCFVFMGGELFQFKGETTLRCGGHATPATTLSCRSKCGARHRNNHRLFKDRNDTAEENTRRAV